MRSGAFSPGLLVVPFVTLLSGAAFGLSDSLLVDVLGGTSALMMVVQMAATMIFEAAVAFVGVLALDRLARYQLTIFFRPSSDITFGVHPIFCKPSRLREYPKSRPESS